MNLGGLLTAGKSLVGLSGRPGRYRVSKQARLPRFISPKNPFAPSESPPVARPVVPTPAIAPRAGVSEATQGTNGANAANAANARPAGPKLGPPKPSALPAPGGTGEAKAETVKAEFLKAPKSARPEGWLSAWGKKLSRRAPTPEPPKPVAQQGELSLDTVRVVRNDLSDADAEIARSAAAAAAAAKPVLPVVALTAEKLEPVGAAWQKLTTKFFGETP